MIAPVKLIVTAGVATAATAWAGVLQAQAPVAQQSTGYGELLLLIAGIGGLATTIFGGLAMLIKAWRDGQIALLKAMDEKVDAAILKVDETLAETKVIKGHVNSAASKAEEAARAVKDAAEATRIATEAREAALRETIADLRSAAAMLALAKATTEAVAAAAVAVPAAVLAQAVLPVEHLQAIEMNTADTAVNTAKTDRTIDAVKDALKP